MSTRVITLDRESMASNARSLKAEFSNANIRGVSARTENGSVRIQMPIAHLAKYRFTCNAAHCSWSAQGSTLVVEFAGYSIEQKAGKGRFSVTLRQRKLPKSNLLREAFFQRSLRVIEHLQGIDEKRIAQAVQEPADYKVLLSALTSDEALAAMQSSDPLAAARLRGLESKQRMLEAEGGAFTSAQAAKALRVSRQAVDKRRRENKLLGLELGRKGYYYPSWQFGLRGLDIVLNALGERGDWEKLSFLLNPSGLLNDKSPLEILQTGKGGLKEVLAAAAAYGEHGG